VVSDQWLVVREEGEDWTFTSLKSQLFGSIIAMRAWLRYSPCTVVPLASAPSGLPPPPHLRAPPLITRTKKCENCRRPKSLHRQKQNSKISQPIHHIQNSFNFKNSNVAHRQFSTIHQAFHTRRRSPNKSGMTKRKKNIFPRRVNGHTFFILKRRFRHTSTTLSTGSSRNDI